MTARQTLAMVATVLTVRLLPPRGHGMRSWPSSCSFLILKTRLLLTPQFAANMAVVLHFIDKLAAGVIHGD